MKREYTSSIVHPAQSSCKLHCYFFPNTVETGYNRDGGTRPKVTSKIKGDKDRLTKGGQKERGKQMEREREW